MGGQHFKLAIYMDCAPALLFIILKRSTLHVRRIRTKDYRNFVQFTSVKRRPPKARSHSAHGPLVSQNPGRAVTPRLWIRHLPQTVMVKSRDVRVNRARPPNLRSMGWGYGLRDYSEANGIAQTAAGKFIPKSSFMFFAEYNISSLQMPLAEVPALLVVLNNGQDW